MRWLGAVAVLMALASPVGAEGFYYAVGKDGSVHIADMPLSPRFKPFRFTHSVNYIRRVALGMRRHQIPRPEVERLAYWAATRHGVDPHLVLAIIDVESGGDAAAVSPAGAQGVMQIMPETARELDLDAPFDPQANIDAGVRYLRKMLQRFADLRLAVAAYNAGPGAVERYGGIPPYPETQTYVARVVSRIQAQR